MPNEILRAILSIYSLTGVSSLGKFKKARRVLGWAPRSNEDAIIATADSLVRLGLLRDSVKVV